MNHINDLPLELLAIVFDNLDAATCFQIRRVCREWRFRSVSGCIRFEMTRKLLSCQDGVHTKQMRQIRLYGQWEKIDSKEVKEARDPMVVKQNGDETKIRYPNHRVKGHLPQPQVMVEEDNANIQYSSESPLHSIVTKFGGVAMRIENGSPTTKATKKKCINGSTTQPFFCCHSIDMPHSKSTYQMALVKSCPINSGSNQTEQSANNILSLLPPRPLIRILKEIDLSGLDHLERLSVRGCSNLEILRLPRCGLKALDASSCSLLCYIYSNARRSQKEDYYDTNGDALQLQSTTALSLNGCRSLVWHTGGLFDIANNNRSNHQQQSQSDVRSSPSLSKYWSHVSQLDLSSICKMSTTFIATCLRQTMNLVSLSLRYVATDEILYALSSSISCGCLRKTNDDDDKGSSSNYCSSLRFVDVAFSSSLTDKSVYTLVQSAPRLERLNLRGCTSVSGACYNEVPIELANRRNGCAMLTEKLGRDTQHLHQQQQQKQPKTSSLTTATNTTAIKRQMNDNRMLNKKRKGDNIFFFTAASTIDKKRSTNK